MGTHKHYGQLRVGLLAATSYNPGSVTDFQTTSTTDTDAGAALAVTFTTPPTGSVLVRLTALGEQPTVGGGVIWSIREGTTTIGRRYITTARVENYDFPGIASFLVTGLTPGSSHTYKWGHSIASNAVGTSRIRTGGVLGQAVMEVYAA